MCADHAIEFSAGDIFTAPTDDVFLARDKTVPAIFVAADQIASVKPAITNGRRRLLGVFVIALQHRRHAHQHFAGDAIGNIASFIIDDTHLRPRHFVAGINAWRPHATARLLRLDRYAERSRHFGHAETFDQFLDPELLCAGINNFIGEAAADDDFQAMPVVVFAARPPRQNGHAGQHHIGARHLRVSGQFPELRSRKTRRDHQATAHHKRACHRIKQRVDMKHRQNDQRAVTRLQIRALNLALTRQTKTALAVHHALRKASGARGIDDDHRIVGLRR